MEKWLGINKLRRLLQMIRLPNEVALKVACPVYEAMVVAPEVFKMGGLQDAIDTEIVSRIKKYTAVVLSNAIYSKFTSLGWVRISDDSILSGFLGNLYFFGEVDSEKQQAINHAMELMREGGWQHPVPMPRKC